MITIITEELVNQTEYKLIKNAYKEGKLGVQLFIRDGCYTILSSPNNKVTGLVEKEMERLYPGIKRI